MKRSKFIRLGLMSASIVILTACGEDEPEVKAKVYESLAQCEAEADKPAVNSEETVTKDDCKNQFEAAKTAHETQAPRYTDKALCEQEFGTGNCESRSSGDGGSSFFMPMMMGYMMGSMGNRGGDTYINNRYEDDRDRDRRNAAVGSARPFYSTPLYRPYSGGTPSAFATPNGASIGVTQPGSVSATPSAFKAAPSATVVSRGGFAARSAGFAAS